MTLRRTLGLLVITAVLFPTPAMAQSESDRATARELGLAGEKALEAGEWKQAEDRFRRADGLFHAPTLTLGLARAQAHEGKFVEAWENYHRIVVDNVTSPPVFAKALEDAKTELATVEGRRAKLNITVMGADAPRVAVNDVPVKAEALGVSRFVDPGHLVVTAAADGFAMATRTVDLAEGKEQTLTIALEKAAPGVAAAAPGSPGGSSPNGGGAPAAAPASGSVLKPLGIGALGLGAAGLVLGAVTGGLAIGKHSNLKTECPTGSCDTTASQSDLSTYQTLGALSTAGFVIGGVGAAGGLVMLLMAPKSESKPAPAAASIQPWFGPGSVGAFGTF